MRADGAALPNGWTSTAEKWFGRIFVGANGDKFTRNFMSMGASVRKRLVGHGPVLVCLEQVLGMIAKVSARLSCFSRKEERSKVLYTVTSMS